ncbi:MAG: hypothetical protein JWQ35_2264, partial [Bacteriovoracaceae bacterium]|nr:hypothetical protein [Bacteriovoracaceae bacterium]
FYHGEGGTSVLAVHPGTFRDRMTHLAFWLMPLKPMKLNAKDPRTLTDVTEAARQKIQPHIDGIPPFAWPENRITTFEGENIEEPAHFFPRPAFLIFYRTRLSSLMNEIRSLSPADSKNRPQFVRLLSNYYHVAINSHLFYRVNNSIFMSHVNYILEAYGLRGISHGYLDYYAFIKSSDQFYGMFLASVRKQNPELRFE